MKRANRTKWFVVPILVAGLAGCANESLTGLSVGGQNFTGSYLAPSSAFTAGTRAASLIPTAGPAQVLSSEEIKSWANKTLQIEDIWVGPFCKKYKVYNKLFNQYLDFNLDQSFLTTGDPKTAEALKQVRAMLPLARGKEQKEWAAYAVKFFQSVMSGKPTSWTGAYPDNTDVNWVTEGWTKDPLYEANQPLMDLGFLQGGMAACLKTL